MFYLVQWPLFSDSHTKLVQMDTSQSFLRGANNSTWNNRIPTREAHHCLKWFHAHLRPDTSKTSILDGTLAEGCSDIRATSPMWAHDATVLMTHRKNLNLKPKNTRKTLPLNPENPKALET